MIPLAPTLALAFVSFLSSAFVILRIVIPILPPHPLSRRVSPAEFGLPNFKQLTAADQSHIWLASFDILALVLFIWQAAAESLGAVDNKAIGSEPGAAARLWLALTIRQTCLLVVAGITLLHVRMGRSVAFGPSHWLLWAPTLLLVVISTGLASVMASTPIPSFFAGLFAYSTLLAVVSSAAFACLIGTLVIIRRNLAAADDAADPWPPVREVEEKLPRPSFATEDVDALRDGSSWITSNASSRRDSASVAGWSFSTVRGPTNPAAASHPSIPGKSSFWFNPDTPRGVEAAVPPVPPLPSPYGQYAESVSRASVDEQDPDPFRRSLPGLPQDRLRMGSQTSWLTSAAGSQATLSAWSYPSTHANDKSMSIRDADALSVREHDFARSANNLLPPPSPGMSRPSSPAPAMASANVLGGYGFAPATTQAEKGITSLATTSGASEVDISVYRAIGWLVIIWVPLALSLPYLITVSNGSATMATATLLMLSVTLSSPLLALNIILRSPLPIPTGLFAAREETRVSESTVRPSTSTMAGGKVSAQSHKYTDSNLPRFSSSHEYKRSGSVTVVEGRRSGDVWISNGDAVDGRSKMSRVIGLLSPAPRLAVMPSMDVEEEIRREILNGARTPPLPMQTREHRRPKSRHDRLEATPEDIIMPGAHSRSESLHSEELGRLRKESKASSYNSGADESLAFATHIMIAQRHYSAVATTMQLPVSPNKRGSTGNHQGTSSAHNMSPQRRQSHLRARSITNNGEPSPPPSFPLPPTPPSLKAARLARMSHKKSFSSGFSFGPVNADDVNEIDALSAGMLPLLVPGLKVGNDMRVNKDARPSNDGMRMWSGDELSPPSFGQKMRSLGARSKRSVDGLGENFSSPEQHSTPAKKLAASARARKISGHKRNHMSLPSLGLGKDGAHSLNNWREDITRALDDNKQELEAVSARPVTMWAGEAGAIRGPTQLVAVPEEESLYATNPRLARAQSTRSKGLLADVPLGINTARSSVTTLHNGAVPPSAASDMTLFEFGEGMAGPLAESTPPFAANKKQPSKGAKKYFPVDRPARRSSIKYIRSDDGAPSPIATIAPKAVIEPATGGFASWSSRVVRPLIPKADKLKRKDSKKGSPGGGLRPLSLLGQRDANTIIPQAPPSASSRSTYSKKSAARDENNYLDAEFGRSSVGRSESSRSRGLLRVDEVLPDVVVRPPSTSTHHGFAYSFR